MQKSLNNSAPTSIAAARRIEPIVGTQRQILVEFVRGCGLDGATAQEMEVATGISGNSVRPRLVQLRRDGLIANSGRVRPTRSQRLAVVWIAG